MKNNGKGFEIIVNEARHILRVRAWGEWDRGLAQRFHFALREKAEDLGGNGHNWRALIDLTAFSAQSQAVWEGVATQLRGAEFPDMEKVACVCGNGTALGFWKQSGIGNSFAVVDDALQWLFASGETAQTETEAGVADSSR